MRQRQRGWEWAPAGHREAGSHGSGLHGQKVPLLQPQLLLLWVSSCSSLLASLQWENSRARVNHRSKTCRVFQVRSNLNAGFWKKKRVGDFHPDLAVRMEICVTQCLIKAWLTPSLHSFSISVAISTLECGERGGRSGLFLEGCLTPASVNLFLSAVVWFFTENWTGPQHLSQTFLVMLGYSLPHASSLDSFINRYFLMADASLQRLLREAFTLSLAGEWNCIN